MAQGGGGGALHFPMWGVDSGLIIHKASNTFDKDALEILAGGGQIHWFQTEAEAKAYVQQQLSHDPFAHTKQGKSLTGYQGQATLGGLFGPNVLLRVVEVVIGVVLVAVAANALLKQTTGINPIGEAANATPAGKAKRVLKAVS